MFKSFRTAKGALKLSYEVARNWNNPDLEKYKELARAILEFRRTPAVIYYRNGRNSENIDWQKHTPDTFPVNLDYFKAAAKVFELGKQLGFTPEREKKYYPFGVDQLRKGSIEGVENPINLVQLAVNEVSVEFYKSNKGLCDAYKLFLDVSCSQGPYAKDGDPYYNIYDKHLTKIAKESELFQPPEQQKIKATFTFVHPKGIWAQSL